MEFYNIFMATLNTTSTSQKNVKLVITYWLRRNTYESVKGKTKLFDLMGQL